MFLAVGSACRRKDAKYTLVLMCPILPLIALSKWPEKSVWGAVVYLAAILLVAGIGMAMMTAMGRRIRGTKSESESGFTLSRARDLRIQGLVTEEEYAQIRQKILGGSAQSAERAEKASGG